MCFRHLYVTIIMILTHMVMLFMFSFCSEWMETSHAIAVIIALFCNTSWECIYDFHSKTMPFFFVCNDWDNHLIFTFWIVLWNVRLCYFFYSFTFAWKKQHWEQFFFVSNFFQSLDLVGKFISFHLYWSMRAVITFASNSFQSFGFVGKFLSFFLY